ncbi:hypothetical protein CK621_14935 [Vandammella animalimorsus]|uniref:Uncharacterized protein n=1 Tax=Vandammella animalimorsus TaxID=2029117 RepID=A0A2A2AN04_9BURK|nr:hypothetical protein CK621_14935 [Vandammella animalimorsus]
MNEAAWAGVWGRSTDGDGDGAGEGTGPGAGAGPGVGAGAGAGAGAGGVWVVLGDAGVSGGAGCLAHESSWRREMAELTAGSRCGRNVCSVR